MTNLLHSLIALASFGAVLLLPGWLLLNWRPSFRSTPRLLQLPAAALTSVVLASIAVVVQLHFEIDGRDMRWAWLGTIAVVGLGAAVGAARPRAHAKGRTPRDGDTLAGWILAASAALLGVVGFVIGGYLDGDALYHTMLATKLAEMPDPTWASTQLFAESSPHAGYLTPGWHWLVAQAALLSGQSTIEVMRAGAGITIPLAALAFASLGRAVFAGRSGALLGLAAFVLLEVLRASTTPLIAPSIAMWPGTFSLWVALPVLLAAWFHTARASDGRGRWPARTVLVVASVAIVALHVTYAIWIGIYLVMWLVVELLARAAGWHAAAARIWHPPLVITAALLVAGGAYVALSRFVLSAADTVVTGVGEGDREFFAELLASTDGTRIVPTVLLAGGALSLVGLIGAGALGWIVGTRATVMLSVASLSAVAVMQIEPVARFVADHVGLSHLTRMPQVIPYVLGVAAALLLAARTLQRARDWAGAGGKGRWAAVTGVSVAVLAPLGVALFAWQADLWRFDEPAIPRPVAYVVVALTIALGLVSTVIWFRQTRRRVRTGELRRDLVESFDDVVSPRPAGVGMVAIVTCAVLAVGAPSFVHAGEGFTKRLRDLREPASNRDALEKLPAGLRTALADLPAGTTVFASPRLVKGIPTLGPIYVASYPRIHTPNTERNRRDYRVFRVGEFYSADVPEWRRFRTLDRLGADVLIVNTASPSGEFIRAHPEQFTEPRRFGGMTMVNVGQLPVPAG